MSVIGTSIRSLTTMAAVGVLATMLIGSDARAQTQASTSQERAAINVVKQWFAAWQEGDADKMESYMSDNVEFRGIPNQPLRMGRDAFVQNTGRFIKLKPQIRITEAVAIGGATGTAVLTKRIDTIMLNGQERTVPLAAFFRVRDGKIEEWLDMPLIPLGAPPAGRRGAPGGNGNTGDGSGRR
jgi:uncharacterized protein (TIGR02246 family)